MKKLIFVVMMFAAPTLVYAQERGGNVIQPQNPQQQPRHPNWLQRTGSDIHDLFRPGQQQQQQQESSMWKRKVIKGEKAEAFYLELTKTHKVYDNSKYCSEPVLVVEDSYNKCFDRGENFRRGTALFVPSRYKCYVTTKKQTNGLEDSLFDLFHNDCGGDDIFTVPQQ